MRNSRFFRLFLILLPVVLGLLFVFRDVVRELVALPAWYIVWLGGLILRSIDQNYYWIALLLIIFMLIKNNLYQEKTISEPVYEWSERNVEGPITRNIQKIVRFGRSFRSGYLYPFEFRSLLISILAYRERQTVEQVERQFKNGSLELPPAINSVLLPVKESYSDLSTPFYITWIKKFLRAVSRREAGKVSEQRYQELESIIEYMELQLEAENDHERS